MGYRVCQRGWEYAQIWGKEGEVSVCSWGALNFKPSIGRLSENTIEEIWNGEDAKVFRESLLDGSYRFCEKEKCPWIANDTLDEHLIEVGGESEYPAEVSLSYERMCNYDCTCCDARNYEEGKAPDAEEKRNKIEKELKKFINDVHTISANGRGELFTSPHILKMLSEWKPNRDIEELHVVLETNGSLFDESHWKQIENLGKYDLKVAITIMGLDEDTYQFLSGCKYPVSKIINNLHFVKELRKQKIVNCFEIGTVIQERNFREMPELTKRCIEEFEVDCVRHRPYFPWGNKYSPIAKWLFDIRNPYHPYYPEYKNVFANPIFKHPKVLMWSGDELSNQKENPYQKDKDNFNVIKWFAVEPDIGSKFEKYILDHGKDRIAVYGWGFTGEALMIALEKTCIKVDCIIDKARIGDCRNDIKVINRNDLPMYYDGLIIVTTPYFFDEICSELRVDENDYTVVNIADVIDDFGF